VKYIICLVAELACLLSAGAQTLVHTSQATPSQPPSTITDVQAASTSQFINSIGVACHFDYYWTPYSDFPEVENLLLQSGIPNIRDGGTDPIAVSRFRALHSDGINVTWVMDAIDGVAPTSAYWTASPHYTLPSFLENVLGANTISTIEISNEIDIFYGNIKWHPQDSDYLSNKPSANNYWGKYIQSLVQDTSAVVRQDPALASIPLIGTSFGLNWAGVPAGAFYNFVDQGAIHPYMYRGNWEVTNPPPYDGVSKYLLDSTEPSVLIDEFPTAITNFNDPYQSGNHQEPLVATETGYFTGVAPDSIDELTQAKYVPRLFAEFFRHSIAKAFVYEFVDEGLDGGMENSFGLVRADLTPKPAYVALQSMISLLQDKGGTFSPSTLAYGFSPSANQAYTRLQYAHDLLLQKSDGDFFLLFWHEISDADRVDSYGDPVLGTDPDVSPDTLPVEITLPSNIVKATLYTYDTNWKLQPAAVNITGNRILVQASDKMAALQLQTSSTAPSATTTTVKPSASQITEGQSLSLTATVTANSSSDTPSGTVNFYIGQTQVGTATLAAGQAAIPLTNMPSPGTYTLTATYAGNSQDNASASAPVTLTIVPAAIMPTTTTLTTSASQIAQGQSLLLSASVKPGSGSTTPAGRVTFYIGQTPVGAATLSAGQATLSLTELPSPGTYALTATYSGNTQDNASTSAPATLTILPAATMPTTTTLTISASQITQGQSWLLNASVTAASGTAIPSGAVTFYAGPTKIGTATLVDGKATLSKTNSLPPGTYNLTATYGGSNGDGASTSLPVVITISPIAAVATSTTLTVGPQPLTVGQMMVLQVGVSTAVPANLPGGTATLYLDGASIGTLVIADGKGSFSVQAPQAGTHTAWAVFAAQGSYLSSQSSSDSFAIQPIAPGQPSGSFTVGLSTGSLSFSSPQAESASLQVTVAPSAGYAGSIQFSCTGLPAGISGTFSPARVTVNGAKVAATLNLSGQIQTSSSQMRMHLEEGLLIPWATLGLWITAVRRKYPGSTRTLFLALAMLAPAICLSGCGLTINNVTRLYVVTVTAVDQNQMTETTTFTLNVTGPGMAF
jgi:Bacterial Ig-like domain (group 3)